MGQPPTATKGAKRPPPAASPAKTTNPTPTPKKSYPPIQLWQSFFLSNWLYLWCFRIASRCAVQPVNKLQFRLRKWESARFNGDKFQAAWNEEVKKNPSKPSVTRTLVAAYGISYAIVGIYKIVWAIFTWLCAYYFLKIMLEFIPKNAKGQVPDSQGHAIAVALGLSALFSSIAIHQLYGECNRIGIQIKAALQVMVYRKSLALSRVRGGAGEVINILSTDVTRILDAVVNFHFLWSAFLEAIAIIIMAFSEVGISALPCLGFVLLLTPVQIYLGKITSDINREQTRLTTERVHIMSEILTAIKLIKFYAWEKPFSEKINELREKEMGMVRKGMVLKATNFMIVFAVPVWTALASLGMYIGLGNKLTASLSFTVLSVYNTLRYPFLLLPVAVKAAAGAWTALQRLDKYFTLEEVEKLDISPAKDDLAFEMVDADFKWDGAETSTPTLTKISLTARKGQKIALIGDVGSGKSSLLAALLGQIRQVGGDRLKIYGRTSYVPQQAWLLNTTLRDNILFGMEYDKKRYKEVVRVCSLQRDLGLLIAGDRTEIAERGANLSGGQRQRVSLARAVYNDADIILLDDPISAVDQAVGRHIFDECFMGFLKHKTVVCALHQLQYLPQMDWVVCVKNGKIAMQGTYQQLMEISHFSELINNHVASGEQGDQDDESDVVNDPDFKIPEDEDKPKDAPSWAIDIDAGSGDAQLEVKEQPKKEPKRLSELNQLTVRSWKEIDEKRLSSMIERNQLTISTNTPAGTSPDIAEIIKQNEMSVYSMSEIAVEDVEDDDEDDAAEDAQRGKLVQEDASAQKTGFRDFVSYFDAYRGMTVSVSIYVFFFIVHGIRIGSDYWLRLWVPKVGGYSDAVYIGIYALFILLFGFGVLARGVLFAYDCVGKSIELHNNIFNAVLRAPMSFFDKTPLGRILSAFSKHLLHIDDTMADAGMQLLQYVPLGLGALFLSAFLIPWNWAPCLGLMIVAFGVVKFTNPSIEKTKALEALTKPPVFAHMSATLEGLFSIRAYGAQARFDALNIEKVDRNHEALFAMMVSKSFQALYLDILSSLIVYFSSLLVVLNTDVPQMDSIAGLALSNALQMLVFVQWSVRMWGDVQAQMVSVGQVIYYADIESEAPAEIPDKKPPPTWPPHGQIDFENVVLRYQKFGVAVLKNITFTIKPREKIGIVGRTGSGKSTLLISLLRIVEAAEGKIMIDGVDVSQIGLADLRKSIAIIPQEPVMFVGSIRSNLDPFSKSTDEEIWKALDAVQLGDVIRSMPGKLDSAVIENGSNFSLGQRQCFCIARAILARTRILVLDEATAAIDMQTDLMIQNAIKVAFSDLTVLTIAHRLNTIIESDRVLVMDAGHCVEFDEPIKLLEDPEYKEGIFKGLVENTGPAAAKKLTEIAREAAEERKKRKHMELALEA
ncbi:Multidrug resistance-associated protein 4 [Quaeritorhiza haematococci]|nr:Multidrug resistance-associated protein 4 [Quaeritorhiza haematococci]